jgi:hypothetical protein
MMISVTQSLQHHLLKATFAAQAVQLLPQLQKSDN